MDLGLRRVSFDEYARCVLPLTHSLWGSSLDFDDYVARTRGAAETAYGKKHLRFMGLYGRDGVLRASFKRYERSAFAGQDRLRAIGIGAVFTPEPFRGKGAATAMLALALDEAQKGGADFAYLFSDIHPQFYRQLGFADLPSRAISVRSDVLGADRVRIERLAAADWTAVRRCAEACDSRRAVGLGRSPIVWSAIRLRAGQLDGFVVREGRGVRAYVIGKREPRHDAYVVDEFGYSGDGDECVAAALLRGAAGDLRRVTGWLPPHPMRRVLPRGSVRPRDKAILMAAPLSAGGRRFVSAAQERSSGDVVWMTDHI